MQNTVKIRSVTHVTHDVIQIQTDKPAGLHFSPGQATEVSINKEGWKDEKRPFTFTSLPVNDYLEFTIKTYPAHAGVTNQLLRLYKDDELILHDVFGDIAYRGEGVFIAGGAGITPFISIFRYLRSIRAVANNKLLFANKTRADIIHEQEFNEILKGNFINILSVEKRDGYRHGYITAEILKESIPVSNEYLYLCGPPPMMTEIEKLVTGMNLGPQQIIKDAF